MHLRLCLLLMVLAGVANADTVRLSAPVETGADYEVFGQPMTNKDKGLSLTELVARQDELDGQAIRVSTEVTQVCQKKGCFFIATEGELWARVTFEGYAFFVPTDSAGKRVTLEGVFTRKALSPEQAAHYAADLGDEAQTGSLPLNEYAISATSVLLPKS